MVTRLQLKLMGWQVEQDLAEKSEVLTFSSEPELACQINLSFRDIYQTWYFPVRSFISRYGFQDELDDLTQEVFLKVWKSLPKFRGNCSLKTWVFQIALNILRDRFRSRYLSWYQRLLPLSAVSEPFRCEENQREVADLLQKVLGRLSLAHREVLILSYLNELSVTEVAAILKIPAGTVKSRLYHAKKKVEEAINQSGGWDEA